MMQRIPRHLVFTISLLSFVELGGPGRAWGQSPPQDSAAETSNRAPVMAETSRPKGMDPCLALHDKTLFKPMDKITTTFTDDGKRLPTDCSAEFFRENVSGDLPRGTIVKSYQWKPTDFFHHPAYLDNVPLERYGQSAAPRVEPVTSGIRFVLGAATLPYRMGIDRPHACVTTLGHQPPGNCVPCIRQTLPWETDAALIQAASAVGLALALP